MIQQYNKFSATTAYKCLAAIEQGRITVTEYMAAYEEIVSQISDFPEQQYVRHSFEGIKFGHQREGASFFSH